MYSVIGTVSDCWSRASRPNETIDVEKAVSPYNITFTIPLGNREIFIPKVVSGQYVNEIYNLRNADCENDGTVIITIEGPDSSLMQENSLSKAFSKSFLSTRDFCRWFIQESELVTMGKGMIIGGNDLPLLVVGHIHIKGCELRKKVLIDKSIFTPPNNPKTAAFIKNTLLKYFLGTTAEVEIADLKELCSIRTNPINLINNEGLIRDSIAKNAEKLFYGF